MRIFIYKKIILFTKKWEKNQNNKLNINKKNKYLMQEKQYLTKTKKQKNLQKPNLYLNLCGLTALIIFFKMLLYT